MNKIMFAAVALVLSIWTIAAPAFDPIDALARRLNANTNWKNGLSFFILLSSNTAPKEVVAKAIEGSLIDCGHGKPCEVAEIRKIRLDEQPDCYAALLPSKQGKKILLFWYYQPAVTNGGWMTRFYDAPDEAEPDASANGAPRRR